VGAHLRDIYDADIDGPGDLSLKRAPTTRALWLLVGVALISLVWAATSIFLFIRAEQVRRPTAHLPSTPVCMPTACGRRPLDHCSLTYLPRFGGRGCQGLRSALLPT
jgi:hypothetical protein